MKEILRIGVFGTWRGSAYIKTLVTLDDVRITALCDKKSDRLSSALSLFPAHWEKPALFSDADEFFSSGLFDAVFLCNYFNEHAHYACLALKKGIHVFSETTAAVTMKEAVTLCRVAEASDAVYMLGENYAYSKSSFELKTLCEEGTLGQIVFAEGEYVHPMSPEGTLNYTDPKIHGKNHWRRYLPITYYCTHALSPLVFATGQRPVRVVGMSAQDTKEHIREFRRLRSDIVGTMLLTTDSGAVWRVNGNSYCAPTGNWYRLSGLKGSAETVRGDESSVRLAYSEWHLPTPETPPDKIYSPDWHQGDERAANARHGGGDYWVVKKFLMAIRGEERPFPDVYEASSMAAVGILGWRSILEGNRAFDIPDFHSEEERRSWENDDLNPFPRDYAPNDIPYSSYAVDSEPDW